MKLKVLAVTAVASLAMLAGCGSGDSSNDFEDESEYAEVCISEQTGTRVEDYFCDPAVGPVQPWFYWGWYPIHYYGVPAIGYPINHGHYVRTKPTNHVTVKRATPRGNAAPLPYSAAEKQKRREAVAAQQRAWERRQEAAAKRNGGTWSKPSNSSNNGTKVNTGGGSSYKPPSTTSRPK